MLLIDQSISVARPATEVLDCLVRAENLQRWDSSIIECVQVGAKPLTVGTRHRNGSKILSAVSGGAQADVVKANRATLVRLLGPRAAQRHARYIPQRKRCPKP